MVARSAGLSMATVGDTVTIEGTVRGYPEEHVLHLEIDDGESFTRTILVDRAEVSCSCPRGADLVVAGEHDTRIQGPQSARRMETIIRADDIAQKE